ncbi:MAG: IS1634 family transposase, partial [Gammaproteobacteria bacterium]|nr:IS1634 family transposase [Gammaproteobacteria bacterium]
AGIGTDEAVAAYKSLSRVERAFRNLKNSRLQVRPIYVYNADRVRAHVFLCALACHVEWHLQRRLALLLFQDVIPR